MDDQGKTESIAEQSVSAASAADATGDATITSGAAATRWLNILQLVAEGAIAHLDLPDLLRELLGRIRESMGADNAAILLMSEDRQHLSVYAARGPEEQVTGKIQIPVGRGIAGTIAASGKPRIVDDLSLVEVENPLLRATVHSLVGAPLLSGDRVIGVIHVDSARPRRFTEDDTRLLEVIASRVALAIEHAQLFEAERAARREAEVATRQLRVLQAISDTALEYVRLQELLNALLRYIQQLLHVDNVAILLPTPDGQELTLYSVHGLEAAVMGMVHVPMGQGVAGTIAATRQPLVVDNLAAVPVANPFLREHYHSLLGVPLLADGRLIGVIHVDTVEPRHFTEVDTRLLQVIADRIGLAIDRARSYESAQQSRVEAETRAAELQEATRRMDDFLSIASHELRTPLTSLNTNIQMLGLWLNSQQRRRADEATADYLARALQAAQPLVQRARQSVSRLDRLVGDLLEASRVRESQLELQRRRADLVGLVSGAVEEVRQAHPGRTVELAVGAPGALSVEVDADRIGQVVTNYVSNALKFSRPTSPISVAIDTEGEEARVAVRDQGVGIPAEELGLIWERFYRVEGIAHQSGSQVGLGLGLYISRDIVERHGGHVGARSAVGVGSTFWFTLPLAQPESGDETIAAGQLI